MNRYLLRKELRAQAPFLALVILLSVTEFFFPFLTEQPDLVTMASMYEHGMEGIHEGLLIFFIIAFCLGLGLVMRERDEGTLEFLDSLPVSRTRIFAVKVALALAILFISPLSAFAHVLGFHLLSQTSLEPELYLGMLGKMLVIDSSYAVCYLGIGIGLAFLRRFAFLAIGVIIAAYLALAEAGVPWLAYFRIFSFDGLYIFHGSTIAIPWNRVGGLLAIGGAGILIGYVTFLMQGDRTARVAAALKRNRAVAAIAGAATAAIFLVWIGVLVFAGGRGYLDSLGGTDEEVIYPSWGTSRIRTPVFDLIYPANLDERAEALAERADAIHEKVRQFFDAEPIGRIVGDLSSGSHYAAGTAHWKRVNMNIASQGDADEHAAVLGHELAHVYLEDLADGGLRDRFDATRWFHEGVASYVEYKLFRPGGDIAELHRVAAWAHRHEMSAFEMLADDGRLAAQADANLAYPLGEVFAEAMAAIYGAEALAASARVFADLPPRSDAPGSELWREIFQRAGFDLEQVIAEYFRRLEALESEYTEFLDALPELDAYYEADDEQVGVSVKPRREIPDGAFLICHFRRHRDSPPQDYLMPIYIDEEERAFWINRGDTNGALLWYQLGYRTNEAALPVVFPWKKFPIP